MMNHGSKQNAFLAKIKGQGERVEREQRPAEIKMGEMGDGRWEMKGEGERG